MKVVGNRQVGCNSLVFLLSLIDILFFLFFSHGLGLFSSFKFVIL